MAGLAHHFVPVRDKRAFQGENALLSYFVPYSEIRRPTGQWSDPRISL